MKKLTLLSLLAATLLLVGCNDDDTPTPPPTTISSVDFSDLKGKTLNIKKGTTKHAIKFCSNNKTEFDSLSGTYEVGKPSTYAIFLDLGTDGNRTLSDTDTVFRKDETIKLDTNGTDNGDFTIESIGTITFCD